MCRPRLRRRGRRRRRKLPRRPRRVAVQRKASPLAPRTTRKTRKRRKRSKSHRRSKNYREGRWSGRKVAAQLPEQRTPADEAGVFFSWKTFGSSWASAIRGGGTEKRAPKRGSWWGDALAGGNAPRGNARRKSPGTPRPG